MKLEHRYDVWLVVGGGNLIIYGNNFLRVSIVYTGSHNKTLAKEECLMGYGGGGTYFDGSFILFLILILLVFGMGFFPYGGKDGKY